MISNSYILNDDWGWFVDIENNQFIQLDRCKQKITKLPKIDENEDDEYEYYKKKYYEITIDEVINECCNTYNEKNTNLLLLKITSTTLLTGLLTYVLLCVL